MQFPNQDGPCPCGSGQEYSKCCYFELKHKDVFQFDFSPYLRFKGEFPVRILCGNINSFLQDATFPMINELQFEIESNGLKKDIHFNTIKTSATTISEIDNNKQVILYEPYCQFLWSLSYALILIYDECLKRPMLENRYKGTLEINEFFHKGFYSFHYAMSLMESFVPFPSYSLPNPLKYDEVDKSYIEYANSVFAAAVTFSLLHELGHQFYGHVDTFEAKKEHELDADEYAIRRLEPILNNIKLGSTYKYGVVLALASLIFIDKTLSGGQEHPDPYDRLSYVMNRLNLDEKDDHWGLASLAYAIWGLYYKRPFSFPPIMEDFKTLFDCVGIQARKIAFNG